MKNLIFFFTILVFISCSSSDSEENVTLKQYLKSNIFLKSGFNTLLDNGVETKFSYDIFYQFTFSNQLYMEYVFDTNTSPWRGGNSYPWNTCYMYDPAYSNGILIVEENDRLVWDVNNTTIVITRTGDDVRVKYIRTNNNVIIDEQYKVSSIDIVNQKIEARVNGNCRD